MSVAFLTCWTACLCACRACEGGLEGAAAVGRSVDNRTIVVEWRCFGKNDKFRVC